MQKLMKSKPANTKAKKCKVSTCKSNEMQPTVEKDNMCAMHAKPRTASLRNVKAQHCIMTDKDKTCNSQNMQTKCKSYEMQSSKAKKCTSNATSEKCTRNAKAMKYR